MAEKLSTGLRNRLLDGMSWRRAFQDAIINVYSGTPPASADDPVTGVLLLKLTKASGAVAAGARSTPGIWKISIGDFHGAGDTVKVTVNLGARGAIVYTFTNTPDAGTAEDVMAKVAQMLNDVPGLMAIHVGAGVAARTVLIQGAIDGEDVDIVDGGGTITITPTEIIVAARINTIHFNAAASGAMVKKTGETWSGVVLASGVAGYYRMVQTSDDGGLSTTQIRKQGTISTGGQELDMTNTSLVKDVTHTVDSYYINQPAE